MSWKQVRSFNARKMGTKTGWCLQNSRLGFDVKTGKFASAKADMESQRKNGTLHTGTPPNDISVPVYCDTTSSYEHVVVWDHGDVYSDGKCVASGLKAYSKIFGWGELCDGVRVVEWVEDNKGSFLPARGYWCKGDNDPRVATLAKFMRSTFPAYTNVKALGSYYGNYIASSILEFQKRVGMSKMDCDGCVGVKTLAKLREYGFKY